MIETVVSSTGEIVSLDEAKQELRVWDSHEDTRVQSSLKAARAYCERWSQSTLRLSTVRAAKFDSWPTAGCVLTWPPVVSIDSITYRDADDAEQTLSTAFYRTHITGLGRGIVEWARDAAGFALPVTRDRIDAVTIHFTTGWQTAEDAPSDAKAAILLTTHMIYDAGDDHRDMQYCEEAAKRLLAGLSNPTYV